MPKESLASTIVKRINLLVSPARASRQAESVLTDGDGIAVETHPTHIVMKPVTGTPTDGIVLYPGGRCDPKAYAPLMSELVHAGYLVALTTVPLNLIVFSADRAQAIMDAHPGIQKWTLGGHSLGGAFACRFAHLNPDKLAGLFLLGSYPSDSHSLVECKFPITLFYGTEDTFALPERILSAEKVLPEQAEFVKIEGGDHYQFGSFSNAPLNATIPEAEQQRQIVNTLKEVLA